MHPYPHTLSIDFGASFTKIAYRSPCAVYTAPGRYDESAEVIALDAVILVPTLAIQTGSDAQPWAFGQTAAGLNPGPKMRVFNNWKAGLFNRDNSPGAASASIIAQAYFRWLRQQLLEVPNLFLNDCKVRVMVPAFNDFKDLIKVLRQCFVHAGWDDERLEFGTEPHANAIGLLSGGRNVYIRGTKTGGNIDYGTTYGINNPYIQSARHQLLPGAQSKPFRITIVDIGAFTTDIAILTFNPLVVGNSDGLQEVAQKSFALGTHSGLDEPLWVALGTRHKLSFANYNFTLREQIKAALFAGETYSVGGVVLGDMIDQTAIEQLATDFAKRIWANAIEAGDAENLKLVYLTGGGSRINPLVFALQACGMGVRAVTSQFEVASNAKLSPKPQRTTLSEAGQSLERIATALGGCSLIADHALESSLNISLRPKPLAVPKVSREPRECTCHGLNPECGRCGGSGYLD